MGKKTDVSEQTKLMGKAVNQAHQHTRELQLVCSGIADALRQGQNQQGYANLQVVLNGIGSIAQVIHLTTSLQERYGKRIDLTRLPGILEPLVKALEDRDDLLIGDLVRYEIEPILGEWGAQLGELSEAAQERTHE